MSQSENKDIPSHTMDQKSMLLTTALMLVSKMCPSNDSSPPPPPQIKLKPERLKTHAKVKPNTLFRKQQTMRVMQPRKQ